MPMTMTTTTVITTIVTMTTYDYDNDYNYDYDDYGRNYDLWSDSVTKHKSLMFLHWLAKRPVNQWGGKEIRKQQLLCIYLIHQLIELSDQVWLWCQLYSRLLRWIYHNDGWRRRRWREERRQEWFIHVDWCTGSTFSMVGAEHKTHCTWLSIVNRRSGHKST